MCGDFDQKRTKQTSLKLQKAEQKKYCSLIVIGLGNAALTEGAISQIVLLNKDYRTGREPPPFNLNSSLGQEIGLILQY